MLNPTINQSYEATDRSFSFSIVNENSPNGFHDLWGLRYQVYCLERKFLPAEDYPDGEEKDEYDKYSTHIGAFNAMGDLVGTLRLVRPPDGVKFPFQKHCRDLFKGVELPPQELCAEVSRLIVNPNYRRRLGDLPEGIHAHLNPVDDQTPVERRVNKSEIVLGLYRELYHYSLRTGVEYWLAAMENTLARVLRFYNFIFKPIGPVRDYYGQVSPYIASIRDLEQLISKSNPELSRWFCETYSK